VLNISKNFLILPKISFGDIISTLSSFKTSFSFFSKISTSSKDFASTIIEETSSSGKREIFLAVLMSVIIE